MTIVTVISPPESDSPPAAVEPSPSPESAVAEGVVEAVAEVGLEMGQELGRLQEMMETLRAQMVDLQTKVSGLMEEMQQSRVLEQEQEQQEQQEMAQPEETQPVTEIETMPIPPEQPTGTEKPFLRRFLLGA